MAPRNAKSLAFAISLALCLNLFLLPGGAAGAEEERREPPRWSIVPYLNWVEETPAPLDEFSFLINGVPTESAAVSAVKYQQSLHVRFPLTYEAETTIEVRRQGESIYRAVLFYAPIYESSIVADTSTYLPFHTEEREKPCQKCHRLTVTPSDDKPPQVKEQICYSCHRHKFDGAQSRHKFVADQWRCLQCHRKEAAPSRWSPDQPLKYTIPDADKIAPLCYRCHKKFETRVKGYRFLHGPLAMGGCTMCHNPHASKYPQLLQNDQTTLCVNCHEMKEKLQKPVLHQVIKSKGCTPCHHPHGSQHPYQLRQAVNDQCLSCHPAIAKQSNNHPVQGHPILVKGGAKEEKAKLTCVSCHMPHASEFPKLLPEEEMMMLCTHCHPMGRK